MFTARSDLRVHYELEPWQVDVVSGKQQGFALGSPDLRASTLAQLSERYVSTAATYGHLPTYFLNRVTAVSRADYEGAVSTASRADQPNAPVAHSDRVAAVTGVAVAVNQAVPAVGDVSSEFAVVDRLQEQTVMVLPSFAEAAAYAQARATTVRPLGIDQVVFERLGMHIPGQDWKLDQRLIAESVAPERLSAWSATWPGTSAPAHRGSGRLLASRGLAG